MSELPNTPWSLAFKSLKEFGLSVMVAALLIIVHIYFTKDLLAKNDQLSQRLIEQADTQCDNQKETNNIVLKALTDNTKAFTEMSMTLKSLSQGSVGKE